MAGIRLSRFYNDPNIGRGFENIASAFAPPDASDQLNGQKALQVREQAARLRDLYENPAQADFSRRAIAAGLQTEAQSMAAVDANNATTRSTNAADNARALQQTRLQQSGETDRTMLAPVAQGATRFVPPKLSALYGVPEQQMGATSLSPGETVVRADGSQLQGTPKPLSSDELRAHIISQQPEAAQRAFGLGGIPTQNVVGPDGRPLVAFGPDAVGQQPAATPVAPSSATNYRTKDGREGTAILSNGSLVDSQNQQPLPEGSVQFSTAVQGKKDDALGAGTQSNIDAQGVNLSLAENTSKQLRQLVTTNPAAQGLVGSIRGTVQDVLATGGEVGKLLNVNVQQMQKDIAAGRIDPEVAARLGNFDPSIPAAKLLETMLTAQVAKVLDPEGRISNDRYKVVEGMLGSGGLLGNSQRTIAALDALDNIIGERRKLLGPSQSPGVREIAARSQGGVPAAPAAPQAAPAAPQRLRFNPATGAIE